jgi:hypothetical protein
LASLRAPLLPQEPIFPVSTHNIISIMFPLTIKLQRDLYFGEMNLHDNILKFISDKLIELELDEVKVDGDRVKFKNRFFNRQGRWHLMATIDSGYFDYNSVRKTLIYEFSTTRAFLVILVISIFFGTISGSIGMAVFIFLWLYGMNWIICIVRHTRFLNELISEMRSQNV